MMLSLRLRPGRLFLDDAARCLGAMAMITDTCKSWLLRHAYDIAHSYVVPRWPNVSNTFAFTWQEQ